MEVVPLLLVVAVKGVPVCPPDPLARTASGFRRPAACRLFMNSEKTTDSLRLGSEFAYVREHGVKHVCRYVVMVAAPVPDEGGFRYGVVCGRKFDKLAVVRNRARRLLKESVRLLKPRMKPCRMVLIPRKMILDVKQPVVQEEIEKLLKRAGLEK